MARKRLIKEFIKEHKIVDRYIRNNSELLEGCKSFAEMMIFGSYKIEEIKSNKDTEDGILILAEANTDAVFAFLGGCDSKTPIDKNGNSFVLHDYVKNIDYRCYVTPKDDLFLEKIKVLENNDNLNCLVINLSKNDNKTVEVIPIVLDYNDNCVNRMKEIEDLFFNNRKDLTDDEYDFLIDEIINTAGTYIFNRLQNSFVFTEDSKKDLLRNEFSKIQANVMIKTFFTNCEAKRSLSYCD